MIVTIKKKRCLIRPAFISEQTDDCFEATYMEYTIRIDRQKGKTGSPWYAWVTHPDGTYIVDGYFDYDTMTEVIQMCMENIHWKPEKNDQRR